MNGMGMMMKSFGIDPEKAILQVEEFKAEVIKGVTAVDERLKNIEAQNASILLGMAEIKVMISEGRYFKRADASRADIMRVTHEQEIAHENSREGSIFVQIPKQ